MLPGSESVPAASEAVMVHILFMDIVGCSKHFTDEQLQIVDTLQAKVRASSEYQKAVSKHDVISIPTGDGMALVFLEDIEAPLRCAIEISRALRSDPSCKVRMGIHSGPVFIVEDINGQRNVNGAGINRAQRVMDCGDGDHILLSNAMADVLRQFRHWSSRIHDIGECRVKDGWQHVWSYHDGNVGSASLPNRSKRRIQRRRFMIAGAAAVVAVAALVIGLLRWSGSPAPAASIPGRSITYSLLVKPPTGQARVYAREMLFPPHYGIKFRFQSSQQGFLYLLNQGPETPRGITWHWLFPAPSLRAGSGVLAPGDMITIPQDQSFELDEKSGREIVFIVWSDRPIPELESIKRELFSQSSEGALTREQADSARTFLQSHPTQLDTVRSDNGTTLQTRSSYLIKSITLEHL